VIRPGLILWTGTQWQQWQDGPGSVGDVAAYGGEVIAAGWVLRDDSVHSAYWSRFRGHTSVVSGPSDMAVFIGTSAALVVVADGPEPLTYRWRKDGDELVDGPTAAGSVISGSGTAALEVSNTQPLDAGVYDCVVSGPCGQATSEGAELSVFCVADFNKDGVVDVRDYEDFNVAFDPADPGADVNGDGFVDGIDSDLFNNVFEAGC
jgi:hypothetical protein